jgi:hypothetical protein
MNPTPEPQMPTPETDAARVESRLLHNEFLTYESWASVFYSDYVPYDFACTLERQRDTALAKCAALATDKERLMLDNASWESTCDRLTTERDAAIRERDKAMAQLFRAGDHPMVALGAAYENEVQLRAELEKAREERDENAKMWEYWQTKATVAEGDLSRTSKTAQTYHNAFDEAVKQRDAALAQVAEQRCRPSFIPTSERLPEPCIPVIGFSDQWADEDYNPKGFRECFRLDCGKWVSAMWNNYQDCYETEQDAGPTMWMPYPESSPIEPTPSQPPAITEEERMEELMRTSANRQE